MNQKVTVAAGLLLLIGVGAAFFVWETSRAHAGESTHDKVERLMPQLMSEDDKVRTEAERQVFALDSSGRDELDKIARGADTRRAITALRLLGKRTRADRESRSTAGQQAAASVGTAPSAAILAEPKATLPAPLRDEITDLRQRFEAFERSLPFDTRPDWPTGAQVRAKASGELVENDRKLTWSIAEDGSVKVTTKDGEDVPEKTFEANSLSALRSAQPDVARRLDDALPNGDREFVFRFAHSDVDGLLGVAPSSGAAADRRVPPGVAQPVLGIEWSPMSEVLREQLGLREGMVVQSVVAGTLAEKLGLARNDVLIDLNGKPVADAAEVQAALAPAKSGAKVPATVVRKGRRLTLEATR